MGEREYPHLARSDLVDDAVRKLSKKISAPIATERRPQMRRRNDKINHPFKLVNKLVRQANASLSGIKSSGIPQLCHSSRDNDEFHFSPARTNAIAS